jgi:ectonucleotide pyrophosphatase/phosphodiesterase family protein 2
MSLLPDPEGETSSESRHLYPPVQESSYGSPLTPAKRPKRKVAPKRRQERPIAPPKKRRRKLHRMDHYAAEAHQDKVSLSIVPKLCGGQV